MQMAVIMSGSVTAQSTGILPEGKYFALPIQTKDTDEIKTMVDYAVDIREKEPDSAIALLNYSLIVSKQLNYTIGALASSNALGILYALRGNEREAIEYFLLAIKIAEKEGPAHSSVLYRMYSNLGNFFLRMEQYEKASLYLNKSKTLAESTGNYRHKSSVMINLGNMYMRQNRPDTAGLYFRKALELSIHYNQNNLTSLALLNLADLRLSQSSIEEALDYLSGAESIKGDYEDRSLHRNYAYFLRGKAYFQLKDYKTAERHLITTLSSLKHGDDYLTLIATHQMLAAIYAAERRFEKAYAHQQTYITLKDSLEREKAIKDINRLEAQYQTKKRTGKS